MMRRLLVIADPYRTEQRVLKRAVDLAASTGASLYVVGFVYQHIKNVPTQLRKSDVDLLKETLVTKHREHIEKKLGKLTTDRNVDTTVEVYWEKRAADWIVRKTREQQFELVIKSTHRNGSLVHTSPDWQLLRGCRAPVLLVPNRQWKKGKHVMAAVDLGTKIKSKFALNYDIVEKAADMATALGCELHVGYVVPFSVILRDLDIVDESRLLSDGQCRADEFRNSLRERGIEIDGIHVAPGAPEKALINMAARNRIGLVVLGCIGRKKLAGRVIGNTAEQILGLLKADALAIKPRS